MYGSLRLVLLTMPLWLSCATLAGEETVADTRFSHDRGIYFAEAIDLVITSATPGATIRYTLNDVPPTPTTGTVYSGPIRLSGNTTVKAIASKSGMIPTDVDTHTYLFPGTFASRSEFGAVAAGHPDFIDGYLALPSVVLSDDDGSHSFERDADERASLEFLYPDDPERNVQVYCGAEQGKKTVLFNVKFKKIYGPGKFKHDIFRTAPDFGELANDVFDGFRLRRGQNEPTFGHDANYPGTSTMMRDQWTRHSQIACTGQGSHGTYVHLWFGPTYQGMYMIHEKPDDNFAANHFGGHADDWWSYKWDGATSFDWTHIDEQLIDYILVNMYAGVGDWSDANSAGVWRLTPPGTLHYYVWDAEWAWSENRWTEIPNILDQDAGDGRDNYAFNTFKALVYDGTDPDLKMLFIDRVYKHLFNDGALTEAKVKERWYRLRDHLYKPGMVQVALQKDDDPDAVRLEWETAIDRMSDNLMTGVDRQCIVDLRAIGQYPAIDPPLFRSGGSLVATPSVVVDSGYQLTLDNPNSSDGTIYYTLDGSDPRLPGGSINGTASDGGDLTTITIDQTAQLRSRIWNGSEWSALHEMLIAVRHGNRHIEDLRITEIMYHPRPDMANDIDGDAFEFIELKNIGSAPIDLTGVAIVEGTRYTFPAGTVLAPGAFLVLARDPIRFQERYGFPPFDHYRYIRSLDNGGERIALTDAAGTYRLSLAYDDRGGWAPGADGHGYSLVPTAAGSPVTSSDPHHWRASAAIDGSPGADDPVAAAGPGVVISEVLTHTDPPLLDSIELHNPSSETVDLTGWYLTDDNTEPTKWRIPGGSIVAGGYLVFDEEDFGTAFLLSSLGEEVFLVAPDLRSGDGFSFGAAWNGVSIGRYQAHDDPPRIDYPLLSTPSLGAANAPPAATPLAITEIMYHNLDGAPEYLELYNASGTTLDLFNSAGDPWRIGGIDFRFPPGTTLAADEVLLLVDGRHPISEFRSRYAIAESIRIHAYQGNLDGSGEALRVLATDDPLAAGANIGEVGKVLVDLVHYDDGVHGDALFPADADGGGTSLHRLDAAVHGNRPDNWISGAPSPGQIAVGTNQPPAITNGPSADPDPVGGTSTTLSVSATDPDGDALTFSWTVIEQPTGSDPALGTGPSTAVTFDKVGDYRFTVTVRDGRGGQVSGSVAVTVTQTVGGIHLLP